MKIVRNFRFSAVILALLISSCMVYAGGYNLAGVGAKALSMSGAFHAIADDHSAMYWNPAGLIGQRNGVFIEAKTLLPMVWVTPDGSSMIPGWDDYNRYEAGVKRTTERSVYPAGSFSVIYGINEKMTAGLSVFAPSALGAKWDRLTSGTPYGYGENPKYPDEDWGSSLQVIDIHPTFAYKVNEQLRVGAGLSFDFANIEMITPKVVQNAINPVTGKYVYPLPLQHLYVNTKLTGDGFGFGFNLGALYDINDKTHVGLSFHSPVTIKLKGKVEQNLYKPKGQGTLTVEPDADADFPLPMDIGGGVAYDVNDRLTVAFDLLWTNWGSVEEIDIEMDGIGLDGNPAGTSVLDMYYESGIRYSIGFNYLLCPDKGFEVRGGYYFDPTPVPDKTLRPTITDVADKSNISLGFAFNLTEKVFMEGYWEHTVSGTKTVDPYDNDSDSLTDNVPGEWKFQVDTIGVSFGFLF